MQYRKVVAVCAVALATRANAQSTASSAASRFDVVAAASSQTRLNENASPARYSGQGFVGRLGYTGAGGTSLLLLSAQGGLEHLGSPSGRRADLVHAEVLGAWLRPITSSLALGASVGVNGSVDTHRYTTPDPRTMSYVFGHAGVGPALLWRGWRSTSVFVTSPLAGVVGQSYSALRTDIGHSVLLFDVATPASLRAATAIVTSAPISIGAFGARLEYRLDALGYDGETRVHALSHSIGISLGRGPR